jgi:hypothetical protein
MARACLGARVLVACVPLVFRLYSAYTLRSFVREIFPRLGHNAHRRVRLESGNRKPLLGMPLFAQVLAVVISAGDDDAARAAL